MHDPLLKLHYFSILGKKKWNMDSRWNIEKDRVEEHVHHNGMKAMCIYILGTRDIVFYRLKTRSITTKNVFSKNRVT